MAWYPNAKRLQGNSGGTFTGGPRKGILHTTEGRKAAGAFSAYRANNSWPHFTVTFENGHFECYQHVDTSVSARALRNERGGVQTNRDGAIQIEIVGTCDPRNNWGSQYVENFPLEYLKGIALLMRWIERDAGIRRQFLPTLKPYPSSYGKGNGVRMSNGEWENYNGWAGHQNVPENTHGDPGLINIDYLLGIGETSQPTPKATDMLKEGDEGVQVINWQKLLNLYAGASLKPDGVFGAKTKEATMNFQRFFNLTVDGIVGPKTRGVMDYVAAIKADESRTPQTNSAGSTAKIRAGSEQYKALHPMLKYPSAGDKVEHLQLILGGLKVDGQFGQKTLARVKEVQRTHRLGVDGIVGPKTWAAIHPYH